MTKIGTRPFAEVLLDLAGGDLERRLTHELAEIVRAVEETGKNGTLALKLTVERDAKVVRITCESKATIPKESVEATAFFTDERGGLHKDNPRQTAILFTPSIARDPS